MKILWILFEGHHENGLVLGAISMSFMVFFMRSLYRKGIFRGGVAKISKKFWGTMPDKPDFFFFGKQ